MTGMIDIHSHVIHCVDDGSSSLDASISLIKDEIKQGVTDIICTPHFRRGMFMTSKEDILKNYHILKEEIDRLGLKVNLYLGQETYLRGYDSLGAILDNDRIFKMNDKPYLLIEFSYTRELDLSEIAYTARLRGYTPIIAHIERYQFVDIEAAYEIKKVGGLIQVNASSIVGKEGLKIKKRAHKYLKEGLVDFVASDVHTTRINYMEKAYDIVKKKYGLKYANDLFINNAKALI